MAQQIGLLKITGTIGGICFYCLDGVYYARAKSSLTGQRVKRDPAFAKTMQNADLLGRAAKIASERYRRTVPKAERSRGKYRELVGVVLRELREETTESQRKIQRQHHEQHEWTRKDVELLATDERRRTQMVLRRRSGCHERHELTRRCSRHRLTRMDADALRRRSAYQQENPPALKLRRASTNGHEKMLSYWPRMNAEEHRWSFDVAQDATKDTN